ncbi:tetratricopeptide repeat protein [Bacillus sp. 31A1R]|uniref:Tetratricopeptide repeat protein n=1 Tax=Robertmurraya mangrovi TaxID=3098077 RepID=A0ABU5J2J6_9BACI|nr:tetratricopeptide repeat protein [Bacillus sp. 31A1R]MDZ5473566.1 tetratricopeptide repeat protein [Bacillus sp. 31A1R]
MGTKTDQSFSHRGLAASTFNKVWDLLDIPNRSEEQNEKMVHLCHSSFWHWTQSHDCTEQNLSIGYWQLSRVYASIGEGTNALKYAERCVSISEKAELKPFYIGYAYEALARAFHVQGNLSKAELAKQTAYEYAKKVVVEDSKKMLIKDLDEIA